MGVTQPETSLKFRAGPETVGNVHHGGAQSLKRPTIFVKGGCTEPETVGTFHHGGAQSLRLPPILVKGGAQSLRPSAIFIMGCKKPETSRTFGEWKTQKVPKA